MSLRTVINGRGARLLHGRDVVSVALRSPGPTHSVFDVLAASVATLCAGPRLAMLGFAAGGTVAALRALGFAHPVRAVDLSLEGEALFRRFQGEWAGEVTVDEADAAAWLRARPARFDAVIEDLSVEQPGRVAKPPVCVEALPALIGAGLVPGGLRVVNGLPVPGLSWRRYIERVAGPGGDVRVVSFDDFENRVVLAADELPSAREVSRRLRQALGALRSRQADRIHVRAFRR